MGDGINVETDQLDDFGSKVDKSTTNDLERGYNATQYQIGWGPTFGNKTQSQVVRAAQQRLAATTKSATANVENYINAAQILANAAREIAAALKQADSSAAARLKSTVDGALYDAQQALNKQHMVDDAKAAAQQQQRELRRAQ